MGDGLDPLMDMADSLAAALVGLPACQGAAVQWKDDALATLSDETLATTQIWVVETAESLLPAGERHGAPVEEFGLLIVVQRKLAAGEDRPSTCRQLSAIVAAITRHCRQTVIQDASCVKTVRTPARNFDDYARNDRFYAEIQTTWQRVLDDD